MGKNIIFVIVFAVSSFAADYTGNCVPAAGICKNGVCEEIEPTFSKSLCPTLEELDKGVRRYLEATRQTSRQYVIIEAEHWFVLHFTD